jgi:hypothetical protein
MAVTINHSAATAAIASMTASNTSNIRAGEIFMRLLFRRARFVNGPPVPAGGTVKDQRMRQLVFDEGNRTLARGADEAGVSRRCQWCGSVHADSASPWKEARQIPGRKMPVLADTAYPRLGKALNGQTKVRPGRGRTAWPSTDSAGWKRQSVLPMPS